MEKKMDVQTHCNLFRTYEYLLTSTAKKLNIPTSILKSRISNAVTIIFSHLITIPLISYILLINFMRSNEILSYELLTELYFSNKLFILIVLIFIVLFSMMLFSSAIYIYLYSIEQKMSETEKKYKIDTKTILIFLLINLFMLFIIINGMISNPPIKWEYNLLTLSIIIYVTVHIIVHIGVSLDIENYCTLRLFFDLSTLAGLSRRNLPEAGIRLLFQI